ncbi:MAG TPA: hypothetical protein VLE43_17835 [Candidatus Saccharimonadia bacterium]|nr:hypothetical protein [Candidatus Saccharimonadia bacterium]
MTGEPSIRYQVLETPDESLCPVGTVLSFAEVCELLELSPEAHAIRSPNSEEVWADGFHLKAINEAGSEGSPVVEG